MAPGARGRPHTWCHQGKRPIVALLLPITCFLLSCLNFPYLALATHIPANPHYGQPLPPPSSSSPDTTTTSQAGIVATPAALPGGGDCKASSNTTSNTIQSPIATQVSCLLPAVLVGLIMTKGVRYDKCELRSSVFSYSSSYGLNIPNDPSLLETITIESEH